jgi:predicted alpha/beta hydrolase family esterase
MPALLSAMRPVLAGALILAGVEAVPAADEVPAFDIAPSCRAAATAAVTASRDENACKTDERVALDKLKQAWGQYNASQRGHCVRLSSLGGAPSYVELLTCLELAKAAGELPDEGLNRGSSINR